MNVKELTERAKSQLAEITGLKPITVTGIFKANGQGWRISLDMLEMSRIPNATDVLGDYEAFLDNEGNMLSFERKATRLRGEPMEKAVKV